MRKEVKVGIVVAVILWLFAVCHNCPGGDNPACCNPTHLWAGTQLENVQDMVNKGRQAKGERGGGAKLTDGEYKQIGLLYSTKQYTQQYLADSYGVTRSAISYIIRKICGELV